MLSKENYFLRAQLTKLLLGVPTTCDGQRQKPKSWGTGKYDGRPARDLVFFGKTWRLWGVPHRATHFPGMMDFRYSKVVLPQLFLLVYKPH